MVLHSFLTRRSFDLAFFFNDTATTEIYTLSLHDALPISIEALEKTCSFFNKRLKLTVNRRIDRVIVKVIDRKTDKVIKEIPSEEIQNMVARIRETIGLLIDEQI